MGGVADQVDDAFQRRLGVDPGRFEGFEFGFEVGELSGERGLLLAGDVGGDDSFHRVLGPLVAVSLDLVDASLQRGGVAS
ncbi:hypothetical protein [Aeromicrobium marinum]|uniref:hypothetical protein n=1 Tax=Aeromicrobium marinum TaxID=219314 RepID=UPI0012E9F814|nr:hypothetical protein [Aeromicrobium marinum]